MHHRPYLRLLAVHAGLFTACALFGQARSGAHLTVDDIMGKPLVCDFGKVAYDVRIDTDSTFYWKDKSGHEETDKLMLVRIDDQSALLGWDENDSTFVSMAINVSSGSAHVIYLTKGREMGSFSGAIRVKE